MPDGSDAPFCADAQGWQFLADAFTGKPKPTSAAPGIAYMAAGGMHYETPDGESVMAPGANTKMVQEPPHWMLLWPVDPVTSGLPTKATAATYIMFAGTPYAHLMIYQDPKTLKL
jgi:predicted metal-binding membrane protein